MVANELPMVYGITPAHLNVNFQKPMRRNRPQEWKGFGTSSFVADFSSMGGGQMAVANLE